jgi:HAD superfamily hydrolase (TIGR01549 family)
MGARALFLDFDGTLHDMAAAHGQALRAGVAPLLSPGATLEDVRSRTDAVWAALWPAFLRREIGEDELYRGWYAEMQRAAGTVSVGEVRRAYLAAFNAALRPYPDVAPALAAARCLRPDVRLAILTNGSARHPRARIAATGLAVEIPGQVISGDIGLAKPDPAFCAHALALVGVAAGEAVMIGDAPEADVAGARRAGLAAVWLNRSGAACPAEVSPGPTVVAADLVEAVQLALGTPRPDGCRAAPA